MRLFIPVLALSCCSVIYADGIAISHQNLQPFPHNNNTITGIAMPSMGAKDHEVWRSSIEVGSRTPFHTHDAEEIVILLGGSMEAVVNGKSLSCVAPCTIILPAHEEHMLKNIGDIPTDQILVMKPRTKIYDQTKQEMTLPWRK